MPDAPSAIRQKLEMATKAYLAAKIAEDGRAELTALDVRVRQDVSQLRFQRVVIDAHASAPDDNMNALYRISLRVGIGTHAEERNSVEAHAIRVGAISKWLADQAGFAAFCTDPLQSGVEDLIVYDILLTDEAGDQAGEHWFDILDYEVPAQIYDTTAD